jgi:hypothetical protein
MRAWIERSRTAFWLVCDQEPNRSATSRLVGSFKIIPLTRSGVAALDRELVTGATLSEEHVAEGPPDTVAYYVGDVVGTDSAARAAIMQRFRQLVSVEFAAFSVYARPLTSDGLRVMRKLGFRRVSDGAEPTIPNICRLDPRLVTTVA